MMENYPEAGNYTPWITCTGWKYGSCDGVTKDTKFTFVIDSPSEQGVANEVTVGTIDGCTYSMEDVRKALLTVVHKEIDGEYRFSGFDPKDVGSYDAVVIDAVMQTVFYGETIFG